MRPKSEIYTPKRDDEHPNHFHMRSLPPRPPPRASTQRCLFASGPSQQEGKKSAKCPNNFKWDCSSRRGCLFILLKMGLKITFVSGFKWKNNWGHCNIKKNRTFVHYITNVTVLCSLEDFVATKFCEGAASFITNHVMSSNGSFSGIGHVMLYSLKMDILYTIYSVRAV